MLPLFLLLFAINSFGQSEFETGKFTPGQLRSDLNYLFAELESIHPNLYYYTPAAKVDSARAIVEAELKDSITRLEFAQKVIPLISMLKDGHTSLSFPQEERASYLKNGGRVFPFDVLIRNNRIFITENFSRDSTIVRFTEILKINNVAAADLLDDLRKFMSAELDFYRDVRVQNSFRRLLWYVMHFENEFALQLSMNGNTFEKTITGATEKEFIETFKNLNTQRVFKPYSFYKLGTLGVIDFRSMQNLDKFSRFLDSTFSIVKNEKTTHLVIDIRNNGGGNSMLGDALFNYITDKPYKQVERMEVKTSNAVKQNLHKKYIKWYMYPAYPFFVFSKQARAYLFKSNGSITVFKNESEQIPKAVANKFSGKTYLLTSHFTFSSANMLADAFKCYNMGTVIGEETGGVLTAFGDLIGITLPNTKLQAWCSHKKFVHPCADEKQHGVKPDVEIITTQNDIQTGRDAAMEYVKQLVEKGVR